jgi:glycosyltransferase involved in cell wall biosynthesis
LRVAVVTALDKGGAEEFAWFLARRLPAFGVDPVFVRCVDGTEPDEQARTVAKALADLGVSTVDLGREECAHWLGSFRPDAISAHCAPDWMLAAATGLGIAWVETLHGMHPFLHQESWPRERERAAAISVQVAVSEMVRRQYLRVNPGYPADRVVTVPNGLDLDAQAIVDPARARAALGVTDEFLFVSLARHCLQKNTFGLVSAFAEVAEKHKDVHLLVAGHPDDGAYTAQVTELVRSLRVADRIHIRGYCANPAGLLAAADAFVLNSFFEGWSLASMQALAAGVPVVLSDVGGAREQLGTGTGRGFLVGNPAGDPERVDWRVIGEQRFRRQPNRDDVVTAMSTLVSERGAWAGRREVLRAESRTLFSADACVHGHATVLRDTVSVQSTLPRTGTTAP